MTKETIKKRIKDEFALAGIEENNDTRLLLSDILKVINEEVKDN